MAEAAFVKDPDAILDYAFDWNNEDKGQWLQTGETISSHTVTVETGLTKDSDSETGGIVTVWLSGGALGESYLVGCKIITNLGRTDERSAKIIINER